MNSLAHGSLLLVLATLTTGCVVQSAMTLVPGAADVKKTPPMLPTSPPAPPSATYPPPTSTFLTGALLKMKRWP